MWNKIVNPKTGRRVNISGKIGQQILQNYIIQLGGNRKTGPLSWHLENETPFGLDDIEGEGDEHRKGRRGRTQVTPQMIRTSKHISADFQKRREENEHQHHRRGGVTVWPQSALRWQLCALRGMGG